MKEVGKYLIGVTEGIIELSGHKNSLSDYLESYQFLFLPTFDSPCLVVFEKYHNGIDLSLFIIGESNSRKFSFQDIVELSQERRVAFLKLIDEIQLLNLESFIHENTRDGIIIRFDFRNNNKHHLFFTDSVLDLNLSNNYSWIKSIVDIASFSFTDSDVCFYFQRLKTYF